MKFLWICYVACLFIAAGCGSGSTDSGSAASKAGGGGTSSGSQSNEAGGPTTVSEADLGVPYYPGSTQKQNGNIKNDAPTEFDAQNFRLTDDSAQKVMDFYKDATTKAGFKADVSSQGDDMAQLSATKGESERITVSYTHSQAENINTIVVEHYLKKGS